MTGRDDLDELHALAAAIADDAHGWRSRRRQRHDAATKARLEAQMVAPVKRRRRHRWITAAVLSVIVCVGSAVVIAGRPGHPAPTPVRTSDAARHETSQERLGNRAAGELRSQGRLPNLFACEGWYDAQQLAAVPAQRLPGWRAGYLAACAGSG